MHIHIPSMYTTYCTYCMHVHHIRTIHIGCMYIEPHFPSGLNLTLVGESKSRLVLKYLCSFSKRSFAVHRRMERSAQEQEQEVEQQGHHS